MGDSPGTLRALQERFWGLVRTRGPVAQDSRLAGDAFLVSDERGSAQQRLGIYASMYFLRLRDGLAEDYPRLAAVLGDEDFDRLVSDYLEVHPSRYASLRFVGNRLPDFVAGWTPQRPWLGDLARLEWTRVELFDQADGVPITMADLQKLPAHRFASLPLRLLPTAVLLPVQYRVDDLWREIQEGVSGGVPAAGSATILVWRQDEVVYHRSLENDEAEALQALGPAGLSFGELCERLGGHREAEVAAQLAARFLAGWVQAELLATPPARRGA